MPNEGRAAPSRPSRYSHTMARILLDRAIAQTGQAFDMFFANLKDLREDDWSWLPEGGARSISAIVGHVVSCKVMYDNHAFGDAAMTWMDPRFDEWQSPAPGGGIEPQRLIEALREAQLHLLRSIDVLADDSELARERPVNWGGTRATDWIITRLVEHDCFHAGEVNHLRAIHQRNDRWEWEQ